MPTPMAQALRIDSIPLTMPDNKCPANISRIEFVMATPGTNGIMAPMIMLSRLCPHPSLMPIHAVNPTAKAPKSSLIKRIFVIVLTLISTQKPIAPTTAAKGISNQSYFYANRIISVTLTTAALRICHDIGKNGVF